MRWFWRRVQPQWCGESWFSAACKFRGSAGPKVSRWVVLWWKEEIEQRGGLCCFRKERAQTSDNSREAGDWWRLRFNTSLSPSGFLSQPYCCKLPERRAGGEALGDGPREHRSVSGNSFCLWGHLCAWAQSTTTHIFCKIHHDTTDVKLKQVVKYYQTGLRLQEDTHLIPDSGSAVNNLLRLWHPHISRKEIIDHLKWYIDIFNSNNN